MRVGFIGAGKVGFSLGKYFAANMIEVSGYYNRSPKAAMEAAEFTGSVFYDNIKGLIRDSDIIFITVPDSAIGSVYENIISLNPGNRILCHCSGALSSKVFSGDGNVIYGYSVHPFFAVNDRLESYKELHKALFTVEGPAENIDIVAGLIKKCGNRVIFIEADNKIKYHAAAVFASNLMNGLMETAVNELISCGFDRNTAKDALVMLAAGNMEHLKKYTVEETLTGPVERCDTDTVKKHLGNITGDNREIYILLSRKVLDISKRKNPEREYNEMEELLYGSEYSNNT